MKLTKLNLLVIAIILLAIGYGIGRYLQPANVVTEVREVEKIKKDVVVVIKERKNPDGSSETETVITDRSEINKETNRKQTISALKSQWRIQGIIGVRDFKFDQPSYGIGIERRIFGAISAGPYYKTKDNEVGVTLSYEL